MIYLVEDDDNIRKLVSYALTKEGYDVKGFAVPSEFWNETKTEIPDLVMLDIMLPQEDGLSILKKLRTKHETEDLPIIMLTAKDSELDKVTGLDLGADDYISKPYAPSELLARVKSQTRRYLKLGSYGNISSNEEIIRNLGLELNVTKKQLFVDGEAVKLTAKEYKIVNYLMHNLGRVFSAEEIYEHIWNETAYSVENTVMVHIRRIREKIEINPSEPKYLKVVWGIGYKIEKYN